MKLTAIRTPSVSPGGPKLTTLLDQHLPALHDRCIVVVSSKIVAISEGRTKPAEEIDRQVLVEQEADYYRSPDSNPYNVSITIKDDVLIGSAGIDLSNGDGHYVLWPRDPQATANQLRRHLSIDDRRIGVIITDSRSTPLRRGATGFGLAHSGFKALVPYVGQADIFGRPFKSEVANVLDGLAAAAVVVMGEGAEQTPLVVIEEADFVEFQDRNPTAGELAAIRVKLVDDVYREALDRMDWDKRPPRT
jgi:F420-0:gamma-glutamyl ligase